MRHGTARLRRREVAAVAVGNGLEFYDFVTYAFFAVQIGHSFFPARTSTGSLLASLAGSATGAAASRRCCCRSG